MKKMTRKFNSLLLSVMIIISLMPIRGMASSSQTVYNGEGFMVEYSIHDGGSPAKHRIECRIENTGTEIIRNWALGFELPDGQIISELNSQLISHRFDDYLIIENSGRPGNLNIIPDQSVHFTFFITADDPILPQAFELCKPYLTDVTDSTSVFFDNGFISIANIGDEPIDNWYISFDFVGNIPNDINQGSLVEQYNDYCLLRSLYNNSIVQINGTEQINLHSGNVYAISNITVYTAQFAPIDPDTYPTRFEDAEIELLETESSLDFLGYIDAEIKENWFAFTPEIDTLADITFECDNPDITIERYDPERNSLSDDLLLQTILLNEVQYIKVGGNISDSAVYSLTIEEVGAYDYDDDELTNYEEIAIYGTDPENEDTDGDELTDGEEIALNLNLSLNPKLNPSEPMSDGSTLDSEREFDQDLGDDSYDDDFFEGNTAIPSINVRSCGLARNEVFIAGSKDLAVTRNPAIIGKAVDIDLSDRVKGGRITFTLEEPRPLNEIMIFRCTPDDKDLIPIDTKSGGENEIYAGLEGSGIYFAADIVDYMQYLDIDMEDDDYWFEVDENGDMVDVEDEIIEEDPSPLPPDTSPEPSPGNKTVYNGEGFMVEYSIHDGGSPAKHRIECRIENTGTETIRNWSLGFELQDCQISELVSGIVSYHSEDYAIISNPGTPGNLNISPGQSASFGFFLLGDNPLLPESFELCDPVLLPVSDVSTGFNNGHISVSNNGDTDIENWYVRFNFTGNISPDNIHQGSLVTLNGDSCLIRGLSFDSPIAPGASKSINIGQSVSGISNAEVYTSQFIPGTHDPNSQISAHGGSWRNPGGAAVRRLSSAVSADVMIAVTTKNSKNVQTETHIRLLIDKMAEDNPGLRFSLAEISSSGVWRPGGWTSSAAQAKNNLKSFLWSARATSTLNSDLNSLLNNFGSSSPNRHLILFSGLDYRDDLSYRTTDAIDNAHRKGIALSVMSGKHKQYSHFYNVGRTGGITSNGHYCIYQSHEAAQKAERLSQLVSRPVTPVNGRTSIILRGGGVVTLDKYPDFTYRDTDTDGDTLMDADELIRGSKAVMNLTKAAAHYLGRSFPANSRLYVPVFDYYSDPTLKDTDGDGLQDNVDLAPRIPYREPVIFVAEKKMKDVGITNNKFSGGSRFASSKPLQRHGYAVGYSVFGYDGTTAGFSSFVNSVLNNEKAYRTNADFQNRNTKLTFVADTSVSGKIIYDYIESAGTTGASRVRKVLIHDKKKTRDEIKSAINPNFRYRSMTTFNAIAKPSSKRVHESVDYYLYSKQDLTSRLFEYEAYQSSSGSYKARKVPDSITRCIVKPMPESTADFYAMHNGKYMLKSLPMFSRPSTEMPVAYTQALAELSMEASTLAYDDHLRIDRVGQNGSPPLLRRMLQELGFTNINHYNYNDNNEDNVSFTTARKGDVTAVIIRGTDSVEWKGNFKLWQDRNTPGEDHYSFRAAADGVKAVIGTGFSKLWITGHSRGAAVANLVAADLTNNATRSRIYAYTFATPNVTTKPKNQAQYMNIRNYVNTQDFVTGVPLTAWGYDKYGVTEVFESTDYRRNNDAFARAYLSLGKVGMNVNNTGKSAVRDFYKKAKTVNEYYSAVAPLFNLCYDHIAVKAIGGEINNTEVALTFGINKFWILRFFKNQADTTIFYAHTPETYYAYIAQRW
ncbi:MAG: cellulose binding domain-containing protein [Oscillospiraceae bacterium]|nr:cellulose binding domain-containing protein [Oscillospiraceae bacterium]